MEFAALTLLLGVLCYAFYDSNIRGYEHEIVLSSELLSMREIKDKSEFTMELLSLPVPEYLRQEKTEKELEEELKEEEDGVSEEDITEEEYIEDEVVESYNYIPDYSYIPEYNDDLATQIVDYALQFVGGPYVYGGNSLTSGTDCSGFTKLVFANFGADKTVRFR